MSRLMVTMISATINVKLDDHMFLRNGYDGANAANVFLLYSEQSIAIFFNEVSHTKT